MNTIIGTCSRCGATAKNPYGPVIPTERTRTYEGSHAGFADAVRVPEPPKENQV